MTTLQVQLVGAAERLNERIEAGPNVFAAEGITDFEGVRLGRNSEGLALLVSGDAQLPTIELNSLRAQFNKRVEIFEGNHRTEETLMVVQFIGGNQDLESLFLDALALLLSRSERPTARAISEFVTNLRLLLAPVEDVSDQTLVGLWGELFVMANSSDIEKACSAWHSSPIEKFDFAQDGERVEVKTTSSGSRSHVISFNQLYPPAPVSVFLASIVTTTGGNGRTIGKLTSDILANVELAATADHVLAVVLKTLKGQGRTGFDRHYDENFALSSLKFYDALKIPAPQAIPSEVSNLTYTVDLNFIEPSTQWLEDRELIKVLMPNQG